MDWSDESSEIYYDTHELRVCLSQGLVHDLLRQKYAQLEALYEEIDILEYIQDNPDVIDEANQSLVETSI